MKPIPDAPGYFADEQGNIYSTRWCTRFPNNNPRKLVPILMGPKKKQRYYVNLTLKGQWRPSPISYLVLITFVAPRPSDKHETGHGKNGVFDDSLANLSWRTRSQNNYEDKLRDGTLVRGEAHVGSKLKEQDIKEIFRLHKEGTTKSRLSKMFKVTHEAIRKIISRKMWAHVQVD